jgi:DNA polymerase I-like protein with 3'-5' exonuclease and polymerase domains
MVKIYARLRRDLAGSSSPPLHWGSLESRCRLVNMLHDELIFEVREEDFDVAVKAVREEMEYSVSLKVPLQVQLKSGFTWGSMAPHRS